MELLLARSEGLLEENVLEERVPGVIDQAGQNDGAEHNNRPEHNDGAGRAVIRKSLRAELLEVPGWEMMFVLYLHSFIPSSPEHASHGGFKQGTSQGVQV